MPVQTHCRQVVFHFMFIFYCYFGFCYHFHSSDCVHCRFRVWTFNLLFDFLFFCLEKWTKISINFSFQNPTKLQSEKVFLFSQRFSMVRQQANDTDGFIKIREMSLLLLQVSYGLFSCNFDGNIYFLANKKTKANTSIWFNMIMYIKSNVIFFLFDIIKVLTQNINVLYICIVNVLLTFKCENKFEQNEIVGGFFEEEKNTVTKDKSLAALSLF